jgi:hypothetical protein
MAPRSFRFKVAIRLMAVVRSCETATLGQGRDISRAVEDPDDHHRIGKRHIVDGIRMMERDA